MAYSDAFRTEAIIRLAVNKYDYDKTSEQMGVTVRTLRLWEKNYPKKGVPELLERAIERLLMVIPSDINARDWSTAVGILFDKWALLQGMPTERTENIINSIGELPHDERRAVIEEAERIIAGFGETSGLGDSNEGNSRTNGRSR